MANIKEQLGVPTSARTEGLKRVAAKAGAKLGKDLNPIARLNFGLPGPDPKAIIRDEQGNVVMHELSPEKRFVDPRTGRMVTHSAFSTQIVPSNPDTTFHRDNSRGLVTLIAREQVAPLLDEPTTGVLVKDLPEEGLPLTRKRLQKLRAAEQAVPEIDLSVRELFPARTREYAPQLIEELTNPVVTKVRGQKINAIIANRDSKTPNGVANVWFGSWGNKVNEGASLLRVAEIAHQNPDSITYGFDVPSHGASGKLTREQKKDLNEGDFSSSVAPCLQVLKDQGVKKVRLFGSSLGGAMAITAAVIAKEQFDIDVEVVGVYGVPIKEAIESSLENVKTSSEDKRAFPEKTLAALYAQETGRLMTLDAEEGALLDLYHSHPFDPRLVAMEYLDRPKKKLAHEIAYFGSNFLKNPGMHYAKGLAQLSQERLAELGAAFIKANPTGNLYFSSGSNDTISPPSYVGKVVDGIREKVGEERKRQAGMQIRPGEGHLSLVEPVLLGSDIKRNSLPLAA